jgi:hypothetical protein
MKQKATYLILLFALLAAGGCKDNNDEELKYRQPFLGQWKEIARGNDTYPELPPDGHVLEFLPDGIYHRFWDSGTELTRSYRVDITYVYYGSGKDPDGHIDRYSFTGTDTLRLDYVYGLKNESMDTPTFNIYERLKNN